MDKVYQSIINVMDLLFGNAGAIGGSVLFTFAAVFLSSVFINRRCGNYFFMQVYRD